MTSVTSHEIDNQVAHYLAQTWAKKNARDTGYPMNKWPYSLKDGETWADEVERSEKAGWVSGWGSHKNTKKEYKSWAHAVK